LPRFIISCLLGGAKLTYSLPVHPIIQREDLLERLGGRKGRAFSRSLRSKVHDGARALYRLMSPRLLFVKERIKEAEGGRVYLNSGITLKSPKLSRTLHDSEEIVCFITTIGGEVDSEINTMMRQGHLSEAFVMDALGSVAVESVAEQFHRLMQGQYSENDKAVTLRFSPGYCDWPVEEQRKLFRLFDSNTAGIELKESCLMMPRKSISAVFGAYPLSGDFAQPPYNPCADCTKTDCPSRRA
jgi:hypothetical protein